MERLAITVLPTILCIKDGKTVHQVVGFDELGVRLSHAAADGAAAWGRSWAAVVV